MPPLSPLATLSQLPPLRHPLARPHRCLPGPPPTSDPASVHFCLSPNRRLFVRPPPSPSPRDRDGHTPSWRLSRPSTMTWCVLPVPSCVGRRERPPSRAARRPDRRERHRPQEGVPQAGDQGLSPFAFVLSGVCPLTAPVHRASLVLVCSTIRTRIPPPMPQDPN